MKTQVLSLIAIALSTSFAEAKPRAPWAHYTLPFTHSRHFAEVHVGQCDDSYYGGFTLTVPGVMNQDFKITKATLDRDCKYLGSKQEIKNGRVHTILFVQGQCDGEIELTNGQGQKAAVQSHTSC